jgi:two-component system sensor histidine kinase KdpD
LHTIREESDRLALLVTNILDMTRLEAGDLQLRLDWLPLEEIVGAALGSLESRLAGREVKVSIPRELPLVKVDAVLLERLLANLIDNALRYTPAGSQIEISASHSLGQTMLHVADKGPGLPPGDMELLFRKFGTASSGQSTSKPGSRGSGLGLSICRAIAEAHGGSIRAGNREGGGAIFTVELPASEAPPQLVPASGEEL